MMADMHRPVLVVVVMARIGAVRIVAFFLVMMVVARIGAVGIMAFFLVMVVMLMALMAVMLLLVGMPAAVVMVQLFVFHLSHSSAMMASISSVGMDSLAQDGTTAASGLSSFTAAITVSRVS